MDVYKATEQRLASTWETQRNIGPRARHDVRLAVTGVNVELRRIDRVDTGYEAWVVVSFAVWTFGFCDVELQATWSCALQGVRGTVVIVARASSAQSPQLATAVSHKPPAIFPALTYMTSKVAR